MSVPVQSPIGVAENLEIGAFRRLWPRRDPTVRRDRDMVLARDEGVIAPSGPNTALPDDPAVRQAYLEA